MESKVKFLIRSFLACSLFFVNLGAFSLSSGFFLPKAYKLTQHGNNTLNGKVYVSRQGEKALTDGTEALLIPVTNYAKQRMEYLYGSSDGGRREIDEKEVKFDPDVSAYHYYQLSVPIKFGRFTFENVADGEFYLVVPSVYTITTVQNIDWSDGVRTSDSWTNTYGRFIMKKVSLKGGKVYNLTMGP